MIKTLSLIVFLFSFSLNAAVEVGDIPPSYLGENRNGDEVQLSEMGGKVVVATFWATWCPPCMKEMQVLEGIQRQVGKDKLEIVAINFKQNKKIYRKIKKSLKAFEITLTHDKRGRISEKYGVKSLPHMFIINKSGEIAHIHKGYGEAMVDQLIRELNELINAS
jgi:thiol-disulfide isomerase/thioredoxin